MCGDCAGHYRTVVRPANTDRIVATIADLYDHPDGGTGGPLHVVLDDYNVDSVEWCEERLDQIGTPDEAVWLRNIDPELLRLSREVIALLKPLSEDERGAVISDYWND